MKKSGKYKLKVLILGIIIIVAGILFTVWEIKKTDRELRERFLNEAELVASTLNLERVKNLQGSPEDFQNSDFKRLKEHLGSVRAEKNCAYVYLLGQKKNGKVFFYIDTQDDSEEDTPPSAPGTIYDEASKDMLKVFNEGKALLEGPIPDKWGVWVFPLVPVKDPETGEVIAVLGMDIDASNWRATIFKRAFLNIILLVIVLILLAAVYYLLKMYKQAKFNQNAQASLISFGEQALAESSLDAILRKAAVMVSKILNISFVEILEHRPAESRLFLRSGVGWKNGWVGKSSIPDAEGSQGGYTLKSDEPVICRNILSEKRFSPPDLFTERNIVCGLTVAIPGDERPYGVIGAHHDEKKVFKEDEIQFLAALANVLAAAIKQNKSDEDVKRFKNAVDNSADQVFIIDMNEMKFLDLNETACRTLGFSKSELLKMGPQDISSEYKKEKIFEEFRKLKNTDRGFNVTKTVYSCKDKSKIPVEVRLGFFKSEGRDLIVAVAHDISERQEAKTELDKQATLITALLDSIPDLIFFKDTELFYLGCNPSFSEFVGMNSDEIVGKSDYDLFPEDIADGFRKNDIFMINDGKSRKNEEWITYPDGRKVPLDTLKAPLRNKEGKIIGLLGVSRDITERNKYEKILRKQSELQSLLMDISSTYISLPLDRVEETIDNSLGELGKFVDADRVYIFDYDFKNGKCSNTHEWCEEGTEAQIENLQELALDSIPEWVDSHRKGKFTHIPDIKDLPEDSEIRKILERQDIKSVLAVPMMDEDECIGFVGFDSVRKKHKYSDEEQSLLKIFAEMLVNIRNRMKIENVLRISRTQAQAASKAKSEFLANMSHEIRTPMNGVIGMAGLLEDTELSREQEEYIGIIRDSGENLMQIINDILDFSKIEAGKMELEILDFNLLKMLDGFAEIMSLKAQEKGLEFIYSAEPEMPVHFRGDPSRIRQILTNLTSNAVKFTDEGEISVFVKALKENSEDIILRFSVKDTGIGISEEKIQILFQQFTQLDASITRRYGGTGLGLAICKQLVELMDGEIGVKSEKGEGSEFWFTVKLEKQPVENIKPEVDFLKKTRLLIVDDNKTSREMINSQFRSWGVEADEASDGDEALRKLKENVNGNKPFKLALIDLNMPGMDGRELIRTVKSELDFKNLQLILMIPLGKIEHFKDLDDIEADDYLTKPIHQSELYNSVNMLLSGKYMKKDEEKHKKHKPYRRKLGEANILLAEDNIVNQQVILGILEKMNLRADAVANGKEALKSLSMIPYDLVLMDVQMSEMDGFEATRKIRNSESDVINHDIPIIALTAHAMTGDREKCLAAGMDDYLSKPVSVEKMSKVIYNWLKYRKNSSFRKEQKEKQIKKKNESMEKDIKSQEDLNIFNVEEMNERLMHDKELILTIIDTFFEEVPTQFEEAEKKLENNDFTGAEREIHSIKGEAMTLGGENLAEKSLEIEKALKKKNKSYAEAKWSELNNQLKIFMNKLKEYKKEKFI